MQEIMQVAVTNKQYLIKDVLILNGRHSSQRKHSATLQIAKQKLGTWNQIFEHSNR